MSPSDPTVVAVARVRASRAKLRDAIEARRPRSEPDDSSDVRGDGLASYWRTAQRMMRRGWHKHPWRPWVSMAQGFVEPAARSMIGPIARDRPVALVAGAACVGALFMATRPWRWLAPKAVAAGVSASFAAATVRALMHGPWLATLVDALTPRESPSDEASPRAAASTQGPAGKVSAAPASDTAAATDHGGADGPGVASVPSSSAPSLSTLQPDATVLGTSARNAAVGAGGTTVKAPAPAAP